MTYDAYVYAIIIDGITRYIGKGSGIPLKRASEHIRTAKRLLKRRAAGEKVWERHLYNRLAKAVESGAKIDLNIIAKALTHDAAFDREMRRLPLCLLDSYGIQILGVWALDE